MDCRNINIKQFVFASSEWVYDKFDKDLVKDETSIIDPNNLVSEYALSKYFSEVIITAMINNIFNKKYVANGYYYTYDDTWSVPGAVTTIEGTGYYPQAIRNFLFGVVLRL